MNRKYYYIYQGGYVITDEPFYISEYTEITEQEYEEAMKALEPTEEEIRAEKEKELHRLLRELYPQEEEETANEEK